MKFFLIVLLILAELQRAKRASEAPWVRKIGNPSSRENLVMTSAYERANKQTSIQTRGGGGGASRDIPYGMPSFLGGFFFRKVRETLISICHVNKRSEWSI